MNDVSIIDHFLNVFSAYIDSGFGLLRGEVSFLTATLVAIDMTLAGLYWALGHATGQGEDVMAKLIRKLLTTECAMPGFWDNDHEPTTNDEWEKAARVILDAALPDRRERWVWANGLYATAAAQRNLIEHKTKSFLAHKLINGPLAAIAPDICWHIAGLAKCIGAGSGQKV